MTVASAAGPADEGTGTSAGVGAASGTSAGVGAASGTSSGVGSEGGSAVSALLGRLDGIERRPLEAQAAVLDEVRRGLDDALARPVSHG